MEFLTLILVFIWASLGCPVSKQDWKERYNLLLNKKEK